MFQLHSDNFSGNCSEITSSESGFAWPESPRSTTAYYVCPNNPSFAVSRECTVEGLWLDFDERGCGVLAQELEMITMMEQDVGMDMYYQEHMRSI